MQKKINHSLRLIANALDKYNNVAIFSSFGKDSMVTLHLCRRIDPDIQVVSVMTPYKPQETLRFKEYISRKWRLNIKTYQSPLVTNGTGNKSLYEVDVEKCCDYYKVNPTKQAIKEFNIECWINGLRSTEGHTRKFLEEIENKDGLIKINPILQWTEADVWLYHSLNNIPVNSLYAKGYRSLGCAPCSKPYTETERGGRWQGTAKEAAECGIHSKSLR